MTQPSKLKVVHWGTGKVGKEALRGVLNHPDLELVGCFAYSADKVGQDAGVLCGLPPCGVVASNDLDQLLSLQADCLTYFGDGTRPEYELAGCQVAARFLERGTNVVSSSLLSLTYPATANAELFKLVDAACQRGNASIMVGGADPGYGTTAFALGALSVVSELEQVTVREVADYSHFPYVEPLVNLFGFSQPMSFATEKFHPGWILSWWTGTVAALADAIGAKVDEYRPYFEPASHAVDIDTGWLKIPAGSIAACRYGIEGIVQGRPLVVFEHITRMHPDVAPQWLSPVGLNGTTPRHQYRCDIKGRPNLSCALDMHATADGVDDGLVISGMHLVNAISTVCAAPAGVVNPLTLPATPTKLPRKLTNPS